MISSILDRFLHQYKDFFLNSYKGNEKAMNRDWSDQKAIPPSKPKLVITKITNRQNKMSSNGQPNGQLFPKRWSLSNPTKSVMD